MKSLLKKGQINMQFIARYPSAILVLAGVLMIFLDKTFWAVLLIGLGTALHILWLRR